MSVHWPELCSSWSQRSLPRAVVIFPGACVQLLLRSCSCCTLLTPCFCKRCQCCRVPGFSVVGTISQRLQIAHQGGPCALDFLDGKLQTFFLSTISGCIFWRYWCRYILAPVSVKPESMAGARSSANNSHVLVCDHFGDQSTTRLVISHLP